MIENHFQEYIARINMALTTVNIKNIEVVINLIIETSNSSGNIWVIGNGGSSSTSSHFVTDLSRCKNTVSEPIRSVSLCDNSALITAIGNDFSFEEIFSKQLGNLIRPEDLLIAISASGNSGNIIKAIEFAKAKFVKTVAITGFNGGVAREICDYSVHVSTSIGDYGVAEDSHSIICHFISSRLR